MGIRNLPPWLPYAVLGAAAVGVLLWLSRVEVRVVRHRHRLSNCGPGEAHLPAPRIVTRSAAVPRSAKSAALGRQLDPAAYVLHRTWVGSMALVVLDDPDDPTPYWLVSCRRPELLLGGATQLTPSGAQSVQSNSPFFSLASRLR